MACVGNKPIIWAIADTDHVASLGHNEVINGVLFLHYTPWIWYVIYSDNTNLNIMVTDIWTYCILKTEEIFLLKQTACSEHCFISIAVIGSCHIGSLQCCPVRWGSQPDQLISPWETHIVD